MKFHNWGSEATRMIKDLFPRGETPTMEEIDRRVSYGMDQLIQEGADPNKVVSEGSLTAAMCAWKLGGRPYYSVYPKIVQALLRTPLDIPIERLDYPTPYGNLLIRFAEGHEVEGVCSLFVCPMDDADRLADGRIPDAPMGQSGFVMCLNYPERQLVAYHWAKCGATFEEGLKAKTFKAPDTDADLIDTEKFFRIAVGIALLDNDPELIVPDVLDKDRQRLADTTDPVVVAMLADRAQRRGKVGWVIGECTDDRPGREVAAHYRNPHLAIRWTGKGRTIPKLCSIKGSVIHKDKMVHVPTGYLDNEPT